MHSIIAIEGIIVFSLLFQVFAANYETIFNTYVDRIKVKELEAMVWKQVYEDQYLKLYGRFNRSGIIRLRVELRCQQQGKYRMQFTEQGFSFEVKGDMTTPQKTFKIPRVCKELHLNISYGF